MSGTVNCEIKLIFLQMAVKQARQVWRGEVKDESMLSMQHCFEAVEAKRIIT